jgi:hypothetical protein
VPLLPRSEIPPLSELAGAVRWLVERFAVDRVKVTGASRSFAAASPRSLRPSPRSPGSARSR